MYEDGAARKRQHQGPEEHAPGGSRFSTVHVLLTGAPERTEDIRNAGLARTPKSSALHFAVSKGEPGARAEPPAGETALHRRSCIASRKSKGGMCGPFKVVGVEPIGLAHEEACVLKSG
jgi:hypothetical protein